MNKKSAMHAGIDTTMSKHKTDKVSKIMPAKHNKAGLSPQAPKVGSTQKNMYR